MPGNTISATLTVDALSKTVTSLAPSLLAPMTSYCSITKLVANAGNRRPVQVPRTVTAPSLQTNPTDFEGSADSEYAADEVQPEHLAVIFHASNAEIQGGIFPADLAESAFRSFCAGVQAKVIASLIAATYTNAPAYSGPASAFGAGDLKAIRDAVASPRRALLLSTGFYSGIASAMQLGPAGWALPGFAAVHECAGWTAPVGGAVLDPSAVVIATGIPDLPRNIREQPLTKVVPVPELGISILTTTWTNPATRTTFGSYEVMLGVQSGIVANASLIVES